MTDKEIKYIVKRETGQFIKPMRAARKGPAFEAKLLIVMLMHEEGHSASDIAAKLYIKRTSAYDLLKTGDRLLSAAPWMPEYNHGFKMDYLGCIKRIANMEHDSTVLVIDPVKIIDVTCEYTGINYQSMKYKSRAADILEAREIAMSLIKFYNPRKCQEAIGKLFGLINHSTVSFTLKRVEEKLTDNKLFRMKYDNISNLLENSERESA